MGGTQLEITDDVEIQGPGDEVLRIDAGGQSRVFYVDDCEATMSGLTITGGSAPTDANGYAQGGGIYNSGTLTVSDSTLSGNSAGDASTEHAAGGGIYSHGPWTSVTTLTVTHSTFLGNWATNGSMSSAVGGGIYTGNNAAIVTDSSFSGNWAESGDAIWSWGYELTVRDSTFSGNGGQPYSVVIDSGSTTATIDNVIISGNSGGGIVNEYNNTMVTTNSTISGNSGCGIGNDGTVTINNSTISGNSDYGLYGGYTTMTNSIVALNGSGDGLGTPSPQSAFNLIDVDPCFVDFKDWSQVGPGADGQWGTADDVLADLRLTSASPAINAGSNTLLPPDAQDLDGDGNMTEPLPIDLAGRPRVIYSTVDIGAYEYWLTGDLDTDRYVGADDLDIVRLHWGQHVTPGDWLQGDANGDGFVGGDDLDLVRLHWGQGTPPVPPTPVVVEAAVVDTAVEKPDATSVASAHDAVLAELGARKQPKRGAAWSQDQSWGVAPAYQWGDAAWWYELQHARARQHARPASTDKAADVLFATMAYWDAGR